jgi:hypothetical protein
MRGLAGVDDDKEKPENNLAEPGYKAGFSEKKSL